MGNSGHLIHSGLRDPEPLDTKFDVGEVGVITHLLKITAIAPVRLGRMRR